MIQELYINNVLMDLDDKFSIALLYDSMLFTDINYLMSNRSTGFSIPTTANNLRVIELSHLSDIQDDEAHGRLYPRRNHRVDYYKNGVPIVTNAVGVLMGEITDRIPFVFVFGNMENTKHLDKKMSELPEMDDSFVSWNASSAVMNYAQANKPGFAFMNFGWGAGMTAANRQYNHPVAPVNWIIDLIASSNGLTIDRGNHFNDMFIPLMTKKPNNISGRENGVGRQIRSTQKGFGYSQWELAPYNIEHEDSSLYPVTQYPQNLVWSFKGGLIGEYTESVRIQINGGLPFDITLNKQNWDGVEQYLRIQKSNNTTINIPGDTIVDNNLIITKRYVVDMSIDVSDALYWSIVIYAGSSENPNLIQNIILPNSWVWRQSKEVSFPGQFPVIPNLPDMKQVEFLKHIMQLRGLFAYSKGLNHIGFISADELIAKKPEALNWTDKLVTDSPIPNAPEGIDFKMNNFAQKNWFRWDNDDEVNALNTDASMTVYNETLEREREALKLPFSGSKNTAIGGETDARLIASIPLYDQDGKMAKLKPRILMGHAGEGGRLEVAFESLGFNHILNTYYDGYRRIVEHPRVITIRVKLTDLDLTEMDLTRPVYFEQFGRHYAILSVQAQADGLCKCKLLEV